ncbi:hypothetical protein ATANTOWER_006996 [Ataeniobius toweri]|uniref:Uncharacterized protein n=1 Tax=Ataeniobius toweri TaxID=208326 RepID=A0ABU7BNV3_9TELE|nr:hypothetical protein [Ataeniobius toweri]
MNSVVCDGLATCPGPTLPLVRRLLEIGASSPVIHYGIGASPSALVRRRWSEPSAVTPGGTEASSLATEAAPTALELIT